MIPGSNILKKAMTVIRSQPVKWYQWTGNTEVNGREQPNYTTPQIIKASVQPTPRTVYQALGLDLQKSYVTCYTAQPLNDLERNGACDMIDYAGRRYNVESNQEWLAQDGWVGALCVDIGAAS